MRDALNATGRPIMYSLCNWGTGGPHLWGQQTGNSWRTGRDVFAVWDDHAARSVLELPGSRLCVRHVCNSRSDPECTTCSELSWGGKHADFAEVCVL